MLILNFTFGKPEWWLVAIGAVTGAVIFWQSWETRKSANAAFKSIKLQELQIQQWIETGEWEVVAEFPNKEWVTLRCKVINPTNMPLTLRTIKFTGYWEMPAYDAQWGVPPRAKYPFQIPGIQLLGSDLQDFNANKLAFPVVLTIGFDDAFGSRQTQRFSVECKCGRDVPRKVEPRWGTTIPAEQHNSESK